MNAYLTAAETTADRERLCLQMLESTAVALEESLSASEQSSVLLSAARRLPSRATAGEPLDGDRCPVLPVVVELLRHTSVVPCIDTVARTENGWELRLSMAGDSPARGLAVAAASQ